MKLRFIFFVIALYCAATPALAQHIAPTSFNSRILMSHNIERARVGVPPLVWSESLAHNAQSWADELARSRRFEHSPQQTGATPQGENLWMGTAAAYSAEEMVQAWIDERADFIPGIFPANTRTGNWEGIAHYTQLIWRNTTQVGCALAHNQEDEYLVCRYSKAGNWFGEDPFGKNVTHLRQ